MIIPIILLIKEAFVEYLWACIIGYLFGCIQTGYIVGKIIHHKDIRELGNGNAGASNATLVFGKKFGLITVTIDILKSVIAMIIIKRYFGTEIDAKSLTTLLYITGLFVILGHNYPFYMGFRGGKGTAATIGIMYGLNIWLGLTGMIVMIILILITNYMTIATMGMLVTLLFYTILVYPILITLLVVGVLSIMSIYRHRKNFINIKNKDEVKVLEALFKKSK